MPSQTRVVPLILTQKAAFTGGFIPVELTLVTAGAVSYMHVDLPIKHIPAWNASELVPLISTYFFSGSTPLSFVAVAPREPSLGKSVPPLLFLRTLSFSTFGLSLCSPLSIDGAGVNVLDLTFWQCAPPRQKRSWLVIPTGRTEWVWSICICVLEGASDIVLFFQGLDWHGPSTADAWQSLSALSQILRENPRWHGWGFPEDTRVVLLGHSNGGQGAWHVASRFPDRVIAGVFTLANYAMLALYLTNVYSSHSGGCIHQIPSIRTTPALKVYTHKFIPSSLLI